MAANGTVDLDGVTMEDGAFTEEVVNPTEDTVNNNTEDTVYEKVELPPINVVGIFATGLLDNILVSTEATQAATAAAIAALGTIPPEWIGHGSPLRAGSNGTMTALSRSRPSRYRSPSPRSSKRRCRTSTRSPFLSRA